MKKAISAFAVALLLTMPLAFAQSNAISVSSLRFKMMGEAFGDFAFNVRSLFAFDAQAKVQLIHERNAEMRSRQQAWLQLKANMSANMTQDERKQFIGMLQDEHRAIIKDHLEMTSRIKSLQIDARSRHDEKIEKEINESEDDELATGLNMTGVNGTAVTQVQAAAFVKGAFGIEPSNVTTTTENGVTYYVINGQKTERQGSYDVEKSFDVKIEADNGALVSANLDASARVAASG